jgi:hypothetical protein
MFIDLIARAVDPENLLFWGNLFVNGTSVNSTTLNFWVQWNMWNKTLLMNPVTNKQCGNHTITIDFADGLNAISTMKFIVELIPNYAPTMIK